MSQKYPIKPVHNHGELSLVSSSSTPAATATTCSWSRISANSFQEESDEELFTVPDVEAQPCRVPSAAAITNNNIITCSQSIHFQPAGKRRRGRNPVDKEYRRLKRLLRNRVSAQQARERKKVYVTDLESRAKDLQDGISKLEEKISTLINENATLRKVLMNTRPKTDESVELAKS
ncbi:hypothetical protein FNV43_RR01122 [Rhamnella rubrinervis]|uniref:BZIP domain-containing protein n=1 Tax=Rhamnella rubrinervis TaxID=2594499 RepID=A0A8K0MS01_9ROSA|nr:hypothetical protein FNV43_RR01122 [Rhamnella rubrinervis]